MTDTNMDNDVLLTQMCAHYTQYILTSNYEDQRRYEEYRAEALRRMESYTTTKEDV